MSIGSGTEIKYKILIAEDNFLNQKLIETYLLKNNYSVITAKNGEEAFKLFEEESPDLIIMDIEMPEVDGCEAVLKIRESECNNSNQVPIIALTGHYLKEDIERIYSCGINDYLPKPIDFDNFKTKIISFLKEKRPE